MRVREARAVVARWVLRHAAREPGFAGAFVAGSSTWLPEDAELPATSDVDVMVVTTDAVAPAKLGKFRWDGVLIEVTYLSWDDLPSAEVVLGSYHLAGSFRTDTVIADPTGRLGALQVATAAGYARRTWVRRRCADAEQRITDRLGALDDSAPWHEQVIGWLFPTGVTTHVLLTAGLRNPTIRLRYPAARALLAEYGRLDVYEELLGLLGCAHLTGPRVAHHLRAMTDVFDATVPLVPELTTPFFFSSDITEAARPIAVDGSHALVEAGQHREAVFWIVATHARCLTILAHSAPALDADFDAGFRDLVGDLGITSPADLRARARQVLDFLPRLREVADAILDANPEIDG